MKKCVLGDVARSIQTGPFGSQLHQSDYTDCGTPVVMPKDVVNGDIVDTSIARVGPQHVSRLSRHQLRPGNLIFSRRGDVGRCALVKKEQNGWLCGTGCLRVVVDEEKINSSYLYYFLCQSDVAKWLESHAVGAIMLNINPSIVSQIPISFPTRGAQEQIANLLSALDRKIALNRRKIATLEKMAKEIYDYWFVQYDFPDANGRPYKSSGGEMVYSPELKREIPKGWRSSSLGEIMQIERKTIDSSAIPDQVIVHYSIPAFEENMYPAFCCASEIQSSKFKIDSEVVLLSKLNPKFKRIWDPPVIGEYSLCSTEFIVCKAKQSRDKPFIFEVLNSDSVQRYMIDGASSSTGSRSRFAADLLPDFPLAIPPQSVIDSFTRIAKLSHTQIKNLRIDITNLTALRDFLLPLLMNGQVRIGGAAE